MGDTAATDSYRVLLSGGEGEIVEKKSRFIATIRKCENEEEAVAFIEEMKKKYWDARHNCSAFIIGSRGELTRCSDDGEPSGTAGRPMLEVLTGSGIRNIAVVDEVLRRHPIGYRRTGAGIHPGGEGRSCPLRDGDPAKRL